MSDTSPARCSCWHHDKSLLNQPLPPRYEALPTAICQSVPTLLRQELQEQLHALPAPAFEHLIALLLERMGYRDIQVLRQSQPGRISHKGRTAHGGMDLQASFGTGPTRTHLAIQVKQYRRPVVRHFVDELRGALLRHHLQQGVLITTSRFSPMARSSAGEPHLLPITLVEGDKLLDYLLFYQLGARHWTPVLNGSADSNQSVSATIVL